VPQYRRELIAYHELSRGTLCQTIVEPRDVFRITLLSNAASFAIRSQPSVGTVG